MIKFDTARIRDRLILVALVAVAAVAYLTLQACDDDPDPDPEICDNGIDDDGDTYIDCGDPDCGGSAACTEICDNGIDDDQDGQVDCEDFGCRGIPPCDGDADGDADGDGDGDGDADGDADSDADDVGPCDPDAGPCVYPCDSHDDCVLVRDMRECCGGRPHVPEGSETEQVCATGAHVEELELYVCIIEWAPDLPEVPAQCPDYCIGIRCDPCDTVPTSAGCNPDTNACGVLGPGGCFVDADCDGGQVCLDQNGDGMPECGDSPHDCTIDDDCTAVYTDCEGCACLTGMSGWLECSCWNCDSTCFVDDDCVDAGGGTMPHMFCDSSSHTCVDLGDSSCHLGVDVGECSPCQVCRPVDPSDASSRRGTCHDLGDGGVEVDGGCEFP